MSNDYSTLADFNYNDEGWQRELQAEIVDKLALQASGILSQTDLVQDDTGHFVDITQYPTVSDAAQQIVSGTDVDYVDFSDYKQRAVWLLRAWGWGQENLIQIIAKKDPQSEIMRQLAVTVAREIQTTAINVVKGIMATALASTHSTGASFSGGEITYPGILAAKQLLGDSQLLLTQAIANSKVVNDAVLLNIASFPAGVVGNEAAKSGALPVIAGMNTWMEDAIAAVTSVYSSYFAAPGALVYKFAPWTRRGINGEVKTSAMIDIEPWRNPATSGGLDIVYVRIKFLVHPLGMQYNSATNNPTNAQLATGSNWTKVADDNRKIKIVELKTL